LPVKFSREGSDSLTFICSPNIYLCSSHFFQEANKKPINVSLYIVGEYNVLNDLVFDGARRLRDNAYSTDLDLLRQNDPCPPPDRWVRPTG
jgi:hypothetical protein